MEKKWWKEGIVYQIYPKSFMDSNGDGIGDCQGIIQKLNYLEELGINIIWLNPVYQSPNDDNGYDISDYQRMMKEFGTMEDWEELLEKLHQKGIKLIMDLVVNHTSDEHVWFIESKKGKNNPYRDYYIWKDPHYDEQGNPCPPNNWQSAFSGSAWEFDNHSGQYYLHLFSKKQPDLNWENENVRNEIYQMMNWWFDKGIDGFRMDVINMISKYPDFSDHNYDIPIEENRTYINGPRLHEFLQEMHQKCMMKYDVFTVGECFSTPPDVAKKLVGADRKEMNMIFQMEHVILGYGKTGKWDIEPWKLTDLKKIIKKWDKVMEECNGWNSHFLMNHDQPRSLSRFGNDKEFRDISAKMLAVFLLTLRGTPFIYQGEEIGMTNIEITDIEEFRDLEIINHFHEAISNGEDYDKLLKAYCRMGRDNARTPMQWKNDKYAGFSTVKPWIKVNPNYSEINVEDNLCDPDSILNFYKKIIQYRKENLTLVHGEYVPVLEEHEAIFAYHRSDDQHQFFVVCNFSAEKQSLSFNIKEYNLEISNYHKGLDDSRLLRPYEARIYKK